jgi:lambda repressor-like predicted transcriptional regulator
VPRPVPDHVAAAIELLDRDDGPTTLGLTMRGAAAASSASRSTLYRRWPTAAALNADAVRWAGTHADSWPARLLRELEHHDLAPALRRALHHAEVDLGVFVRTAVSAWPSSSPERAAVVAWEGRWLAHLEVALDRAIARRGERWRAPTTARIATLGLAAAIEGTLLIDLGACGPVSEERRDAILRRREATAAACARFVLQMVEPGARSDPPIASTQPLAPLDPLVPAELAPGASQLLERIAAAIVAEPTGGPASIVPGRVVEAGRLARHLGISERRLFQHWPTAADLNGDLLEFVLERERRRGERLAARTLELGMRSDDRRIGTLLVACLAEATSDPATRAHFRFAVAMVDPAVRHRVRGLIGAWWASQRATFLAMITVTGWYLPSDAGVGPPTDLVFHGVAGAQRLVCSHPALAYEVTDHPGGPRSSIGLACVRLAGAALTTAPPSASPGEPPTIDLRAPHPADLGMEHLLKGFVR